MDQPRDAQALLKQLGAEQRLRQVALANGEAGRHLLRELNGGDRIVLEAVRPAIRQLHAQFWQQGAAMAACQHLHALANEQTVLFTLAALAALPGRPEYRQRVRLRGQDYEVVLPGSGEPDAVAAALAGYPDPQALAAALVDEALAGPHAPDADTLTARFDAQEAALQAAIGKRQRAWLGEVLPQPEPWATPATPETVQAAIDRRLQQPDAVGARKALRAGFEAAGLGGEVISLPLADGRMFRLRVREEALLEQLQQAPHQAGLALREQPAGKDSAKGA